jgi:alkaline phosphatase D
MPCSSLRRHILGLGRRGLLRGAAGMAALAALQPAASRRVIAQPVFARYPFTLGVASGDPLSDGLVIWTRLAPEPLAGGGMPRAALPVAWEVAADERFARTLQRGTALARPELGHAVHVEVGGLEPGRPYWYRFRAGAETSPVGRTRTAPAEGAAPPRVRFVNAGCQHWESGFFTAWRHVAEEAELDFVFHYGDYIYEYRARGEAPAAYPAVRQHNSDEIYTLDDYRNRYALYHSDPDLRAAHAAHPFVVSYDDHEVDNNWAGAHSEEDGSDRFPHAVPPEILALRKQIAFQAWYEHMPVRRASLPRGPEIQMFRGLRYGGLLDLAVLDTRQYRDDQPCSDGVKAPCAAVADPQAQILGARQERWLVDRLAEAPATWKVVAQQVPMMRRDFGESGTVVSMDKWDAYPAARRRLLTQVHDRRIENLVVLSGDVHQAWAGSLRPDFDDERGPVVGTEFVGSSITSFGDGSEVLPTTERVLSRNPHIAFFNNRRGYTLHEATPERMEAVFRAVPYVSRPGAAREDRGRFAVEAGRPGPQRA